MLKKCFRKPDFVRNFKEFYTSFFFKKIKINIVLFYGEGELDVTNLVVS